LPARRKTTSVTFEDRNDNNGEDLPGTAAATIERNPQA
jgi:hypothetical protein